MAAAWSLYDVAVVYTAGQPELAWEFGPAVLWNMLGGGLGGALLGALLGVLARGWILGGLLISLGLSCSTVLPLEGNRLLATRAILAGLCACLASDWLRERLQISILRAGLALGVLAAVGLAACQPDVQLVHVSWLSLGLATASLALGLWTSAGLRIASTGLLLLLASAHVYRDTKFKNRVERPESGPNSVAHTGPGRDLLLVILDTVRADRLAPYGHTRQTTPNLDRFVDERAERYAWARSASSWTLPSHASLFTGLLPSQHGATHPRGHRQDDDTSAGAALAVPMRTDVTTLAETLSAHGYRTGAVMANYGYLGSHYGLDRGYEFYDVRAGGNIGAYVPLANLFQMPIRAGQQNYRDATSITDRALAWLAKDDGKRPQFLTLNYMDAHTPYRPAAPYDMAFGLGKVESIHQERSIHGQLGLRPEDRSLIYDQCLLYLDSELGRLFENIDFDNTVVIVTSDHGEALGDHGYWRHGWTLFDSITRVPLYVNPVGRERVRVRQEPIGGAQVFGLALHELGLADATLFDPARPTGELFQTVLIPAMIIAANKDVERDLITWTEGTRKLLVSSTGQVRAFDVALDPGEQAPLALSPNEIQAALERARIWWAANPPHAREALDLGEEHAERLRDLGYMGDEEE